MLFSDVALWCACDIQWCCIVWYLMVLNCGVMFHDVWIVVWCFMMLHCGVIFNDVALWCDSQWCFIVVWYLMMLHYSVIFSDVALWCDIQWCCIVVWYFMTFHSVQNKILQLNKELEDQRTKMERVAKQVWPNSTILFQFQSWSLGSYPYSLPV